MEMNIMHGYGHHNGRGGVSCKREQGDGTGPRTFGYYFHIKEPNAAATWRRGGAVGLGFGCRMESGWGYGMWDVEQLCAVCGGSAAYFKINARGGGERGGGEMKRTG